MCRLIFILSVTVFCIIRSPSVKGGLPTLYEYYTSGGIQSGLSADKPYFTLNGRNISLYSGTMHYFRVPKQYWRDRLRKMRAAGLIAVETYVPWNLHEPRPGEYDFGQGGSDMQEFLDVKAFLTMAKEEDLFAIVRPGPFICSEWEFGGFPSWLLRVEGIKFRTSNAKYMKRVSSYFNVLMPLLASLQFTKGGPIIALQVENEYGSTKSSDFTPDKEYLKQLRKLMLDNGIVELLVTSDGSGAGSSGSLPGLLLQTVNFQGSPEAQFAALEKIQPGKPVMAMEFWTGWFDHWSENHHKWSSDSFYDVYERILKYNASVNMYMFHGGTSFGFTNGANLNNGGTDNSGYQPDTTSYDYDAPLSETGDYTAKYSIVKDLLAKYNAIKTKLPEMPVIKNRTAYDTVKIQKQLSLNKALNTVEGKISSIDLVSMEMLPINNNSGQSFGYTIYRKTDLDLKAKSELAIKERVCDTVMVLLNNVLVSPILNITSDLNKFGSWRVKDSHLTLTQSRMQNVTLDLVVENWGRVGFGNIKQFFQYKGLWQGGVYIDNSELLNWEIIPLEFKTSWIKNLDTWDDYELPKIGPTLYKASFNVDVPIDTYLDMQEWTKGIVIVNGFVLGRYSRIGPQQALYLPAPLLKSGDNEVIVFEHFVASDSIKFSSKPIFVTN